MPASTQINKSIATALLTKDEKKRLEMQTGKGKLKNHHYEECKDDNY